MKAAFRTSYCSPENLKVDQVARPFPKENEVLIQVKCTTVNRTDLVALTGKPYIIRLFTGFFRPKMPIPGTDFAGVVTQVGSKVEKFQIGDRVWGFEDTGLSSQAEYLVFGADGNILKIPDSIGFEQAVASAEAAHYAYNFLRNVSIKKGQKVMVNGGTGAIGSALIQILKQKEAYIVATCAGGYAEKVRSLGADRTIDYLKVDFTQDHEIYDYVFDAVGKSTFSKSKKLLTPKGLYCSSELGPYIQNPFLALLTGFSSGRKVKFPIPLNIKESMIFMSQLLEEGKFHPLIDQTFPIEEISKAYTYVASGQKIGNVLISMES
jgi:NADPH:quinone reductase-like Zn-dependent oxidoreductase